MGERGISRAKRANRARKPRGDFPVGPAGQENGERHTRRHHGNAQICQPGGEEIHGKAAQDGSNQKRIQFRFFRDSCQAREMGTSTQRLEL